MVHSFVRERERSDPRIRGFAALEGGSPCQLAEVLAESRRKIAPNSNEANPYRLARSRRWESGSRSYSALGRSMTLRKTRSIRPRAREDEDVLTLEGTAVVVEARLAPVARRAHLGFIEPLWST